MSATTPTTGSPWHKQEERSSLQRRKREAVLAVAAQLFAQKGFSATSLDDVAAALQVTKPTIYHYCHNKDDILFGCLRNGLNAIRAVAEDAAGAQGPALWRLVQVMRRYGMIMTQDIGRVVTRTGDYELAAESRDKFRSMKREIDLIIRQLVQEGIADGSLKGQDPVMITFTITGALNWIGRWYHDDGSISATEAVDRTITTLLDGLRP